MKSGSEEAINKLDDLRGGGSSERSTFKTVIFSLAIFVVTWCSAAGVSIYLADRYEPFSLSERLSMFPWDFVMIGTKGVVYILPAGKYSPLLMERTNELHLMGHWGYYVLYSKVKGRASRPFEVWARVATSKKYKDAAALAGISDISRLKKITLIINRAHEIDKRSKNKEK